MDGRDELVGQNHDFGETIKNHKVEGSHNDAFLQEAELRTPYLKWRKAVEVPWQECVRDSTRQPVPTPELNAFFDNNKFLRREMLSLLKDMSGGRVDQFDNFKARFAGLHKALILGEDGSQIYMNPDQQVKIGQRTALDIAGSFGRNPEEWDPKLKDLQSRLKEFLDPDNAHLSTAERVSQIGLIFFHPLNGYASQFAFGNNSLNMNIVNGLLRLSGLNGIPHGNLDIEFMVKMNKSRFSERFLSLVKATNPGLI